jgi:hypothetical protein
MGNTALTSLYEWLKMFKGVADHSLFFLPTRWKNWSKFELLSALAGYVGGFFRKAAYGFGWASARARRICWLLVGHDST